MSTMIIDYGMGNLRSAKRAFEECGAEVFISDEPKDLDEATHIVLPGVGAFSDAMKNLREKGWIEAIRKTALVDKIPFLGICLGMQLLASKGYEGGETEGLNLIPGDIKKFEPISEEYRIPHVGWNEIQKVNDSLLLNGITDKTDFYFVHSYHFIPLDSNDIVAVTPYCEGFVSIVSKHNIFGTQFHPEKSHPIGFKLIENFLSIT